MNYLRPTIIGLLALAALLAPSSAVQPAKAASIEFFVEGTVISVSSQLSGTFSLGDTFRVEYTFDSLTPDSDLGSTRGVYNGAITALSVTVDTYSASAAGDNSITVNNTSFDQYRIDLFNPGLVGPSVAGFDVGSQTPILQLRDPTGTALTTDVLPTSPLNFGDFVSGGTFLALAFSGPNVVADVSSFGLLAGPPVGGIAEVVVGGGEAPASTGAGAGSSSLLYAAILGGAAAAVALAAAGWYARRRWLR